MSSAVRPSAPPRRLAVILGLALAAPFLVAAGPQVSGVEPMKGITFHDPVTQRSAEYEAALTSPAVPAAPAAADVPAPAPAPEQPRVFATVEGVELVAPTTEALAYGFHEGSTRGLALAPVGRVVANQRGIEVPADDPDGVDYVIMATRGRSASPTSAVDIAVPEGVEIAAPVTGTIVDVARYALYGNISDLMVTIRPADLEGVLVRVFHLEDATVAVGDEVVAGETVISNASRPLPVRNQVDKWAGRRGPHVHFEVERG